MEFGTIENLHLLIIAELKLYKPYAVLNTVKFKFIPGFKLVHIVLKKHFPLRILANLSHFFLSPAPILENWRYGTWTLELLKIFTCGLLNLYAKHGELIKICMFLFEL